MLIIRDIVLKQTETTKNLFNASEGVCNSNVDVGLAWTEISPNSLLVPEYEVYSSDTSFSDVSMATKLITTKNLTYIYNIPQDAEKYVGVRAIMGAFKSKLSNVIKTVAYSETASPKICTGFLGGVSGSFTTADHKTVTVTNGLITAITS